MVGGTFIINLIVAFDKNRLIGDADNLPWNIPEDLKKFKELTTGNVIIMGRKTYESIGRPLPNRINVVISRTEDYKVEKGVYLFKSIEEALYKMSIFHKEIFFIGGAQLYKEVLDKVDRMYISHVDGEYRGDVYFPEVDWSKWKTKTEEKYERFTFREYVRV